MSQYQTFCYAEKLGVNYLDSYQQKRFRIFNVEVTEKEYFAMTIPTIELKFDLDEDTSTIYQTAFKKAWKTLSLEQKQEFFNLPHFNADIFFKITGVDLASDQSTIVELSKRIDSLELELKKLKNLNN